MHGSHVVTPDYIHSEVSEIQWSSEAISVHEVPVGYTPLEEVRLLYLGYCKRVCCYWQLSDFANIPNKWVILTGRNLFGGHCPCFSDGSRFIRAPRTVACETSSPGEWVSSGFYHWLTSPLSCVWYWGRVQKQFLLFVCVPASRE